MGKAVYKALKADSWDNEIGLNEISSHDVF